ncbi:MAG: FMN-binding protein [Spirochaetaceae bacterium]|jgi:fumarate reductase flavoprotein subunit|nr:FMN-binding protein [Spirochaetaceae bacterium]
MKRYITFLICAVSLATAFFAAACLSFKDLEVYKPGSWEGSGAGYSGIIHLLVETDAVSIVDITVLDYNDDVMIGGEAISELKELILETDSTDVDAVSGATQTSVGFIDAVNNALSKARIKK